MHQVISSVSILCLVILLLIFLFKRLRQPYLVAYIIAGIILGPYAGRLFTAADDIATLGEVGILLLMFFLGIEIEVPDRGSFIIRPAIAQLVKTVLCVGLAFVLTYWLHWTKGNILVFSAVLIFNSTAIVSEFLKRNGDVKTSIGKTVLNVLLLQDVMLAPAFVLFWVMNGDIGKGSFLILPLVLCGLIVWLIKAIRNRNLYQLPFIKEMETDHELQVFAGAFLCLGFAMVASLAGLTESIGSFAAGIVIGRTYAFHWLERVLSPFKVFFTALFFVSIGLRLDVDYLLQNHSWILTTAILVLLVNSLLSAFVFRLLNYSWRESWYAGALLGQTGEFGLLSCSLAYSLHLIDTTFFKAVLAITILTFLLSTFWMTLVRRFMLSQSAPAAFFKNTLTDVKP